MMRKRIIATVTVLSCVLSLFAGITVSAAEKNYETVKYEDVTGEVLIANIDFKVLSGQSCDYALRFFDSGNEVGTPFGAIRFNKEGRVLINPDARHWNQDWMGSADYFATYEKASFNTGVTYNLKVRFDIENGTVEYFMNDEYIAKSTGTACGPWWNITSLGEDGMQDGFEWKVNSLAATKRGEMGVELSEFDDEKISVVFSETPMADVDFSKVRLLNTNEAHSGADAEITSCAIDGATVEFAYKNDLSGGCEYVLVFPEGTEGKLGGKLKDNFLYFNVPLQSETEFANYNFEASGSSFEIKKASGDYATLSEKAANRGKNGSVGLLVKGLAAADTQEKSVVGMNWDGFTVSDASHIIISFDVLPLQSDLALGIRFLTKNDNSDTPLMTGFSATGKFIGGYLFDTPGAMKGKDDWWSNRTVLADYKKDNWMNVAVEWDNTNKKGYIYKDGQVVTASTAGYNPATTASDFIGIDRVRMYSYPNLMQNGGTGQELMILDNVKVTVIEEPVLVNQIRFNDLSGGKVGPKAVTDRNLESIDVYFNDKVSEATLNSGIALTYNGSNIDFDVTYDSTNKCATLTPKTVPAANDKVELAVAGVKDEEEKRTVKPYTASVTASNTVDGIVAENTKLVYADGTAADTIGAGEAYVSTVVANTTNSEQAVGIFAMGYKDSVLSKLEYKLIKVQPRTIYQINEKSDAPLIINTNDINKISIGVQTIQNAMPLGDCFDIVKTPYTAGEMTISGNVSAEAKNVNAIIEVYAPDKSFTDLSAAKDFRDVLIYKSQIKTDNNGNYSDTFSVDYADATSGMYAVKIMANDIVKNDRILYVNPVSAANTLIELNKAIAAADSEKAGEIILNNHYDLYIDDSYVNESLADAAAKILINSKVTLTDKNVKTLVNKAVGIAGINAGAINEIIGKPEIFDLDGGKLKDVYTADYVTDKTENKVIEMMKTANCTTIDDFDAALTESFVLVVVAEPERPGSVAEVLKLVDLDGYGAEAQAGVANGNYNSIKDLKKELDSYEKKNSSANKVTSTGGTGGGGGGATGSYKIANDVAADNTQDNIQNNQTTGKVFNDLSGYEWAEEQIVALYNKGVVSGTGNGGFEPQRSVAREEFVKLLCVAFGMDTSGAETDFADVNASDWYAPYVAKAVEVGMVKGISDTIFGSGSEITREDMAVIICRTLAAQGITLDENGETFADDVQIADYAKDAVSRLSAAKIVNGKDNGNFEPKASATRAEAAVIISRCIDKFSL